MDSILHKTSAPVTLTIRDAAGDLLDADSAPTVVVKDSAGTTHVASQTSTSQGVGTGAYDITLTPAQTTPLDTYEAVWSATLSGNVNTFTTRFQVVGGFLFGIGELRTFDADITAAKYPAARVREAREAAEERIEELAGVAFVPRGKRETLDGNGTEEIQVSHVEVRSVVSASIDGTALTTAEVDDLIVYPEGFILRDQLGSWDDGNRNVVIHYTHGLDQAPEPVRRAAMALAKLHLVQQGAFDRARAETTELGTISFSLPGRDGPTGIPEVDAVISQFGRSKFKV